MSEILHIYTDGSCSPNPGPGGWGWASFSGDKEQDWDYGGEFSSTNNIMELTAVIEALDSYPTGEEYKVFSDSQYVVKGLVKDVKGEQLFNPGEYTGWMKGWISSGWKKPKKNIKLWKKLDKAIREHLLNDSKITFEWVKAHNSHPKNDRADELANIGREKINE